MVNISWFTKVLYIQTLVVFRISQPSTVGPCKKEDLASTPSCTFEQPMPPYCVRLFQRTSTVTRLRGTVMSGTTAICGRRTLLRAGDLSNILSIMENFLYLKESGHHLEHVRLYNAAGKQLWQLGLHPGEWTAGTQKWRFGSDDLIDLSFQLDDFYICLGSSRWFSGVYPFWCLVFSSIFIREV